MGFWSSKVKQEQEAIRLEMVGLRAEVKALKKVAKKMEKAVIAMSSRRPGPVQVIDPQKQKAENIIQKLAESLDVGGGMSPASKLGSWRAAKTAEYASQKAALTMGNIGVQDPD